MARAGRRMVVHMGVAGESQAGRFLERGAGELYFGLKGIPSHRRDSLCLRSRAEVRRVAALAAGNGARTFLAANEIYGDGVAPRVEAAVLACLDDGVDGVILRDPGMIRRIRARRPAVPVVLSSLGLVFNAEALAFYADLGVTRVTVPQHLAPGEAAGLFARRRGLEMEIFHLGRCFCANTDGACFLHYPAARGDRVRVLAVARFPCFVPYAEDGAERRMARLGPAEALAAIHDYWRLGAGWLKVGRKRGEETQEAAFLEAVALARLLESGAGRKDFVEAGLALRRGDAGC